MIAPVQFSMLSYHTQQKTASVRNESMSAGTSFRTIRASEICLKIPGASCLYSGADGKGQNTYIEYTKDSSENDPTVRISGNSLSGEYDQIVHINEVDPSNATYPELCALLRHKQQSGEYSPGLFFPLGVPSQVECGDYSQCQNFTQIIKDFVLENQRYNSAAADEGKKLLATYERFCNSGTKMVNRVYESTKYGLLDYLGHLRVSNAT